MDKTEFTIKARPFSWDEKMADLALEDFSLVQKELPYCICQSIGMALAKLKMIEDRDCRKDGTENEVD